MGCLGRSVAVEDRRSIAHMDAAALGRLVRLRSRANASARSMRSRGAGRAAREAAEKEWAEARREADGLERGKPYEPRKPEAANPPSGAGKRKKTPAKRKSTAKSDAPKKTRSVFAPRPREVKKKPSERMPPKKRVEAMTENEVPPSKETASIGGSTLDPIELAESINRGYALLASTKRGFARASYILDTHERRMRIENAEALLEAKNARAMDMYLEGLMDSEEYRTLWKEKARTELAHFDAKSEVDRLKLLVRLMEASKDNPEG